MQRLVRAGGVALGLWLLMSTAGARAAPWQGPAQPVYPCVKHRGRLTAYSNGIAVRIWLVGTTRVVHPTGDLKLPPDFDKYLDPTPPNSYGNVYGDFEICPLEPDTPGQMRTVRVASAERLVVESAYGQRPSFKVMSTWPPTGAAGHDPLGVNQFFSGRRE